MEHHFNIEIATRYGILEAVILNNFYFWIKKNEANDKNFHDGYYWTYNSAKALHKLFPYASERKIRNAIKMLEDEGLIITGNYNQSAYDRTMWYALTENAISILQNCKMEVTKEQNQNAENVRPIPYRNTNTKTDIYKDVPVEIKDVFMEWVKMRKEIKKPVTTKNTVTRSLNKLNQLSQDAEEQKQIIEQSIDSCWQGFYPLKDKPRKIETYHEEDVTDISEMPDEIRASIEKFLK